MPAERLKCADNPTFMPERRQCAGGQTYRTRSLKVRVVPIGDIANRRTEVDFVTFLDQLLAFASPQISWRIVCDGLGSFIDVALAWSS